MLRKMSGELREIFKGSSMTQKEVKKCIQEIESELKEDITICRRYILESILPVYKYIIKTYER